MFFIIEQINLLSMKCAKKIVKEMKGPHAGEIAECSLKFNFIVNPFYLVFLKLAHELLKYVNELMKLKNEPCRIFWRKFNNAAQDLYV